MPKGALLLAASVNGEQINPRFVAPDQLAVVLPAGKVFHRLLLRWIFASPTEPLWQPKLATALGGCRRASGQLDGHIAIWLSAPRSRC